MINLNLLSKSSQKTLAKNALYIELANYLIIITGVLIFLSILFVGSTLYLSYITEGINDATATTAKITRIDQINYKLSQASVMEDDFIKWSRVITNFTSTIPEGITLELIIFDKENKTLTISGFAESRDDFLTLQKNMKQFDLIKSVQSPISNLLHQNNFNFSLIAELILNVEK